MELFGYPVVESDDLPDCGDVTFSAPSWRLICLVTHDGVVHKITEEAKTFRKAESGWELVETED